MGTRKEFLEVCEQYSAKRGRSTTRWRNVLEIAPALGTEPLSISLEMSLIGRWQKAAGDGGVPT